MATPFPTHLFKSTKGEKDFKACLHVLQRLPSIAVLLGDAAQHAQLPPPARELLRWLLTPDNRRANTFAPVSLEQFSEHVRSARYQQAGAATGKATVPPDFRIPAEVPTAILRRLPDSNAAAGAAAAFAQPVVAFHGTCFENVHSILNTGLVNVSATRATMQRNGAIFGAGIYLRCGAARRPEGSRVWRVHASVPWVKRKSVGAAAVPRARSTRFDVAFSFSKPAAGWRHSALGGMCRCLLVCEVDMAKVAPGDDGSSSSSSAAAASTGGPQEGSSGGAAASGHRGGGGGGSGTQQASPSSSSSALPESYLLVTRPDAIRLLYVLVYREQGPEAARAGGLVRHWPSVLVGLYLVFILVQSLLHNRQVQLQLGRWWRRVVAEGPDAHVPAWQRWQ